MEAIIKTQEDRLQFSSQLLHWYQAVHRKLPWRETQDPYRIWLSEVMLQQTQVVTVIEYYNRFVAAFPTIQALAQADEDAVFKLWEGLGYYSRARNLMKCAKAVVNDHQGHFPVDLKAMLKLPGIGPYTAGAVLSIAFNQAVPAVDGNVMRVISRVYGLHEDIADPKSRVLFEDIVYTLLPDDRRHFNQALMELGATLCTPKSPACDTCPVGERCQAKALGLQASLPYKSKKIQKTSHEIALAYVTHGDTILLVKRHEDGLLSGLWGFPLMELPVGDTLTDLGLSTKAQRLFQAQIEETYGLNTLYKGPMSAAKHVFTHRIWHMTLHHFEATEVNPIDFPVCQWLKRHELKSIALSTAYHKLLRGI